MAKNGYLYNPPERNFTPSIYKTKTKIPITSIILYIFGVLASYLGYTTISEAIEAKGSMKHEIVGSIFFLISAVFFVGGLLNSSIKSLHGIGAILHNSILSLESEVKNQSTSKK